MYIYLSPEQKARDGVDWASVSATSVFSWKMSGLLTLHIQLGASLS